MQRDTGVTILHPDDGRQVGVLNDIVTFKVGTAQTGGAFALMYDRVYPGGGIGMHRQTGHETFIIFKGELEIQLMKAISYVTSQEFVFGFDLVRQFCSYPSRLSSFHRALVAIQTKRDEAAYGLFPSFH